MRGVVASIRSSVTRCVRDLIRSTRSSTYGEGGTRGGGGGKGDGDGGLGRGGEATGVWDGRPPDGDPSCGLSGGLGGTVEGNGGAGGGGRGGGAGGGGMGMTVACTALHRGAVVSPHRAGADTLNSCTMEVT